MVWNKFAQRSREPELIDGECFDRAEYLDCLADLRQINRYLGGLRPVTRHLYPLIEKLGLRQVRLLDVGTGSADIPAMIVEWGRARGIGIDFTVIDLNHMAATEARAQVAAYPEIRVVRANALEMPFADGAFDFVLASLFLHHFDEEESAAMLRGFARVARVAFLVNDLRRHPLAYFSIKVLTRLFTRNRLIRHDAAVSVLRGFTDRDLAAMAQRAGLALEVHRHFPYRYLLTGSNHHDDGRSTEDI